MLMYLLNIAVFSTVLSPTFHIHDVPTVPAAAVISDVDSILLAGAPSLYAAQANVLSN
jgi:hypothetical protein